MDKVKRSENGVITDPFYLHPDNTLEDANNLMGKFRISGVPITDDDGKLVGIITNRDLKFEEDYKRPIKECMTSENLVTAPVGITLEEAKKILGKARKEKLPIVDDEFKLRGLITIKDIEKAIRYPNSARDKNGRLLVGAAIGVTNDALERVKAVYNAGVDVVVLDSAHGHSKNIINKVKEIKEKVLPELDDDFAQDVSDFDTLAEYKEDLKKTIATRKENEAKAKKEDEAIAKIIESSKMDIPEAMINTQVNRMLEDFAQRLQAQGLSVEQYFQYTGVTAEKIIEDMKPQAVKNIQSRLVLEAVVKAENIEVSDAEFEEELNKMAEQYKMEIEKIKEFMGEYESKQIREDIAIQKAVDVIVNSVVEK